MTFVQDWLAVNVQLPKEGSLKYLMELRNREEEQVFEQFLHIYTVTKNVQARVEREEAEAEKESLKAMQLAEELSIQIREDNFRQQIELEKIQRTRRRGMSDATQVPLSPVAGDTPTESFGHDIEWEGVVFNTVKLFHPRKGDLHWI